MQMHREIFLRGWVRDGVSAGALIIAVLVSVAESVVVESNSELEGERDS